MEKSPLNFGFGGGMGVLNAVQPQMPWNNSQFGGNLASWVANQAQNQNQYGSAGSPQFQAQAQLDAARANAMQAQMAPLQQMQSLLPFVSAVPAGFSNIQTQFGVQPSPLMAGLGAGLSALGGLGSFFNPPQTNYNFPQTQQAASTTPATTTTTPTTSYQYTGGRF